MQAVLLVGFDAATFAEFQAVMQSMDADMVPLFCASPATMKGSLQQALEGQEPGFCEPPEGARRALIVSGMYTAEVSPSLFCQALEVLRCRAARPHRLWHVHCRGEPLPCLPLPCASLAWQPCTLIVSGMYTAEVRPSLFCQTLAVLGYQPGGRLL